MALIGFTLKSTDTEYFVPYKKNKIKTKIQTTFDKKENQNDLHHEIFLLKQKNLKEGKLNRI